jgi:hypothetical protein
MTKKRVVIHAVVEVEVDEDFERYGDDVYEEWEAAAMLGAYDPNDSDGESMNLAARIVSWTFAPEDAA